MPHESSGFGCGFDHTDAAGAQIGQCFICKRCEQWVRPEAKEEKCPAEVEAKEKA